MMQSSLEDKNQDEIVKEVDDESKLSSTQPTMTKQTNVLDELVLQETIQKTIDTFL